MKLFKRFLFVTLLFTLFFSQPIGATNPAVLPLKERAMVINNWLEIRLEKVLPEIMRREKFSMRISTRTKFPASPGCQRSNQSLWTIPIWLRRDVVNLLLPQWEQCLPMRFMTRLGYGCLCCP